jgi:hypothetical protein
MLNFSSIMIESIHLKTGNLITSKSKINKHIRKSLLLQSIEKWKEIMFTNKDTICSCLNSLQEIRRDSIKSNNSKGLQKMDSLNEIRKRNNKLTSRVEESKYHSKSTIKLNNII